MRSANVQFRTGTRSNTYASPTLEIYYTAASRSGALADGGPCLCSCITPLLDLSATPNFCPLEPKHKYARYVARLPPARADITVVTCIRHDGKSAWSECTRSPAALSTTTTMNRVRSHPSPSLGGRSCWTLARAAHILWRYLALVNPRTKSPIGPVNTHTKPEPPNPTYTPMSQPLKQWVRLGPISERRCPDPASLGRACLPTVTRRGDRGSSHLPADLQLCDGSRSSVRCDTAAQRARERPIETEVWQIWTPAVGCVPSIDYPRSVSSRYFWSWPVSGDLRLTCPARDSRRRVGS
jgi:hypothetical protein